MNLKEGFGCSFFDVEFRQVRFGQSYLSKKLPSRLKGMIFKSESKVRCNFTH